VKERPCRLQKKISIKQRLKNKKQTNKGKEQIFDGYEGFGTMGTSVSRSEEETEEMVGDDCGGSMWFAGSNISVSLILCVSERE
jgi:hypothetical protein